jgi:hypothetical protein
LAFGPGVRRAIPENESLKTFVEGMRKFEREFCDHMVKGKDFTLRLEVRGDKSRILHCRCQSDSFDRPLGPASSTPSVRP